MGKLLHFKPKGPPALKVVQPAIKYLRRAPLVNLSALPPLYAIEAADSVVTEVQGDLDDPEVRLHVFLDAVEAHINRVCEPVPDWYIKELFNFFGANLDELIRKIHSSGQDEWISGAPYYLALVKKIRSMLPSQTKP